MCKHPHLSVLLDVYEMLLYLLAFSAFVRQRCWAWLCRGKDIMGRKNHNTVSVCYLACGALQWCCLEKAQKSLQLFKCYVVSNRDWGLWLSWNSFSGKCTRRLDICTICWRCIMYTCCIVSYDYEQLWFTSNPFDNFLGYADYEWFPKFCVVYAQWLPE